MSDNDVLFKMKMDALLQSMAEAAADHGRVLKTVRIEYAEIRPKEEDKNPVMESCGFKIFEN